MCFEFDYLLSTDSGAAANESADSLGYGSYVRSNVTREKNADPA